jgi:antitoxin (DNA-binding transcriptional repressor) of toxin-antitoxin stability system
MHSFTISEAKAKLPELIRQAINGEEAQITSGRRREPVVRLVAIQHKAATRRIGFLAGKGDVGPEFWDELPEEELRLWNCEGE